MSGVLVYIPINTTIDPSTVQVFGETVTTSDRIINLQNTVSVSSLRAFLKYQEDPSNRDNVFISTLKANDSGIIADLSGCLAGLSDPDLSSYLWWPGIATTDPNYLNTASPLFHYTSVYEVLLSQIAYDIFGHPLAKAGIANDTAILSQFARDNVANRLVADLESLSSSNLRVVYQQMLAQAPTRFGVQDSMAGSTPAIPQQLVSLPFEEGDTIRFEITLSSYAVSLWGGSMDTMSQTPGYSIAKNKGVIGSSFPSKTYTLNIHVGSSGPTIETILDLSSPGITSLPTNIPSTITRIVLDGNSNFNFSELPNLPSTITFLSLQNCRLTSIPQIPQTIQTFIMDSNAVVDSTSFTTLPSSLRSFTVDNCGLTSVPEFPSTINLKYLSMNNNTFTNQSGFASLPDTLYELSLANCGLSNVPVLPSNVARLTLDDNDMSSFASTAFANISPSIIYLSFANAGLTVFPSLPQTIRQIYAPGNTFTDLTAVNNPSYTAVYICFSKISQQTAEAMATNLAAIPSETNAFIYMSAQMAGSNVDITTAPFSSAKAQGWNFG